MVLLRTIRISSLPVLPIATTSTASGLLVTFAAIGPARATSAPSPTPTARSTAPTTAPGSVITITGGPNATANIAGPRNDAADFYGIVVALVVIVVAIAITRVVFGWRTRIQAASEPAPVRPAARRDRPDRLRPRRSGARRPASW